MNKDEAIQVMIKKVEKIERDKIASSLSIEPVKFKKEAVEQIYKALKELKIEDEDK